MQDGAAVNDQPKKIGVTAKTPRRSWGLITFGRMRAARK